MPSLSKLTLAFVALYASLTLAVQPIEVQGSDFVNSVTGDRLQIVGVAYQPGGSAGFKPDSGIDPLSNGTNCLRDAALMQKLGVNAIRVYNLDPSLNHDECASIFNAVGIYMILDVNSPLGGESLVPGEQLEGSYNDKYLGHIFSVVEAFHNYDNVLGFFSANEVLNDIPDGGPVPPYIRSVTRDLKNYIAKHSPRKIPVGYSAADVREILADSWAYLSCNIDGKSDDMSRIDFFGLNSYSWCGSDATFSSSGYDKLVAQFSKTTIPVFFSEYGCNKVLPRVFDEVQSVYGAEMTKVMSGGLVYEYYQQVENNYGLVWIYDNGTAELRIDYDNLQKQFNKLDSKALQSENVTATKLESPTCKDSLIQSSTFTNDFDIPKIPKGGQALIDGGVSKPNNGRMVKITDTKVTQDVYGSNGKLIPNLSIKPLPNDQSNTPDGSQTGGSATDSAGGASPTKEGAAGCLGISGPVAITAISLLIYGLAF